MDFLLVGGYDNGMLERAEQIAKVSGDVLDVPLCYVSTRSEATECELPEGGCRSRQARFDRYASLGFSTVSQVSDICSAMDLIDKKAIVIIDSVTALLWNEMFGSGDFDVLATGRVMDDLEKIRREVRSALFVSHNMFCATGIRGNNSGGNEHLEYFRKGLAEIQKNLARSCAHVEELSYGIRYRFK